MKNHSSGARSDGRRRSASTRNGSLSHNVSSALFSTPYSKSVNPTNNSNSVGSVVKTANVPVEDDYGDDGTYDMHHLDFLEENVAECSTTEVASNQINATHNSSGSSFGDTSNVSGDFSSVLSSNPWSSKSGVEMYDMFHAKGLKMGHVGNRAIRLLVQEHFLSGDIYNNKGKGILAKKKEDIITQRRDFNKLSLRGLKVLREYLFNSNINISGGHNQQHSDDDDDDDVNLQRVIVGKELGINVICEESLSLQGRIVHLAKDEDSQALLIQIFAGTSLVTSAGRREVLDDKSQRSTSLWTCLADEFVNNPAWSPVNELLRLVRVGLVEHDVCPLRQVSLPHMLGDI